MRATPETCPMPAAGDAPTGGGNSGSSSERLTLPQFFMRQRGENEKGKVATPDRELQRKEAYEKIVANKEITPHSRGTYADVLTREFMAIKQLQTEGTFTPTGWQQRILDAGNVSLKDVHTNGEVDLSTQAKEYDAYRAVFLKLLEDGDMKVADEWLVTAMEVTKRQIIALEAITQAQVEVLDEAEELHYVDDIEAMSAALSNESGRSIDEVREEILKLKNKRWPDKLSGWRGRFRRWKNRNNILRDDRDSIAIMWNEYEHEVGKRLYSTVDVEFVYGHTVDYTRTVNGQPLDEVQKKMVENLEFVGKRGTATELGTKGQKETARLLKSMTAAQQDAYFAKFDTQLRTQDQLNLLVPDPANPNNFWHNPSGLNLIHTGIEGVPEMPVNLDNIALMPLDQRLDLITRNLGKRIEERALQVTRSEVKENVSARVHELEQRKQNRRLSPEEEARKTELTERKAAAEEIQRLSGEIQSEQAEIDVLSREVSDALTARTEKQTETTTKATKEAVKSKKDVERQRKETKITENKESIKALREGLAKDRKQADQIAAINAQIAALEGEVTTLEGDLHNAGGIIEEINSLTGEIETHQKEIDKQQAIIDAQSQQLQRYDQLLSTRNIKKKRRDALVAQYAGQQMNPSSIERELKELTGISDVEQHEMDVLDALESHILDGDKWNTIQNRARIDKYNRPDVAQQLKVAMDARPHVQPAYLHMMRILGGESAIKNTSEGHTLFLSLSKMVPPELFFDVYLQDATRLTSLQAAYQTAHGHLPTLDELTIYNEALQEPTIRNELLQHIDKDFMQELLTRLIDDASAGVLGVPDDIDKDKLREIEQTVIPAREHERRRQELQRDVEQMRVGFMVSEEVHKEFAAETIIEEIINLGESVEQSPDIVDAVLRAIKEAGIDRDVAMNDLTNPPLDVLLSEPFVDLGIVDLNRQQEFINQIRKSGLSREDVEPIARAQHIVENVGLDRRQTPYVASTLQRAVLAAGLSTNTITVDTLVDATGVLTPAGQTIQDALQEIGVNVNADQQVTLINGLLQEPVTHIIGRGMRQKLEGTIAGATTVDVVDHAMVGYRTVMQFPIDRTKPFIAADVTADIRTKVTEEYNKIGIDISTWTVDNIAEVIEAMRQESDVLRTDLRLTDLRDFRTAIQSVGFTPEQTFDIYATIQDFAFSYRVPGEISTDYLRQSVGGRTLEFRLRDMLDSTLGAAASAPVNPDQLVNLVNRSLRIPRRTINESTIRSTQQMNEVLTRFLDHEGSYHEGAVLAVLMAEADVETIDVISQAFEQVWNHKEDRDIVHILGRIPDPPRTHIRERIAHIQTDGARGFIDQYNALTGAAVATIQQIPVENMRRLAETVLAHRLGAAAHPFVTHIAEESRHFSTFMNAQFNRVQFERSIQTLNSKFWGLEDTYLVMAIEKEMGGSAYRREAHIYAQAIQAERKNQGFTPS